MTLQEEIKQRCPADVLASRDHHAIAAAASIGRKAIASTLIGVGDVLALGPAGGPFLDSLVEIGKTERNVGWAMVLLNDGRLDIGIEATRSQVRALAEASPDVAPLVDVLLALGERDAPITEYQVRCTLWNAAGDWLGD